MLLESVGRQTLGAFGSAGRFAELAVETIRSVFRRPFDVRALSTQVVRVGINSVPVVLLTAAFTGAVLALQTYTGFSRFHAQGYVGSLVSISLMRELGPVLTALMVAGRAGSAMAAEIGSMRVTEQIDALVALATDPIQHLFVPRVLAGILVLPMLVVLADATGIAGGYLVSVRLLGANPVVYTESSFQFLEVNDLASGLIKSAVFGGLLAMVGCVRGFETTGGAEGVGSATTGAVVQASLGILIADFLLTKVLS